jgi:hypothetical protein
MKISVVLPVYNCPAYVGIAIESILNQTFEDFEFLIIDDGSNDETPEVLKRYNDPRVRHIRHENRGLAGTLNVGIELALGKYIARQDQDDISLPDRLERQFAYMEEHPECGLLGTWAQIMEGDRLVQRFHRHPADPSAIQYALLLNNPFVHSSVMIRKSVLEKAGGYSTDPARQPPEDYELWSRLARQARVANLPEVYLHYREVPNSMSRQGPSPFRSRLIKICSENLSVESGVDLSDPDLVAIAALTHGAPEMVSKMPDFRRVREILQTCAKTSFGGSVPAEIASDIEARIAALRGCWVVQRGPLTKWIANPGPLRNFLKRVHRILFRRQTS